MPLEKAREEFPDAYRRLTTSPRFIFLSVRKIYNSSVASHFECFGSSGEAGCAPKRGGAGCTAAEAAQHEVLCLTALRFNQRRTINSLGRPLLALLRFTRMNARDFAECKKKPARTLHTASQGGNAPWASEPELQKRMIA